MKDFVRETETQTETQIETNIVMSSINNRTGSKKRAILLHSRQDFLNKIQLSVE